VKPENLLFAVDGRLRLTVLGRTSFADGRTVTVNGKISGTLMYMAPECLLGRPADVRSDIFSLGVLLEEMAGDQAAPEAFRSVVARATARDRSQRFQTVDELAASLRRLRETAETVPCETPTILVIEDDDGLGAGPVGGGLPRPEGGQRPRGDAVGCRARPRPGSARRNPAGAERVRRLPGVAACRIHCANHDGDGSRQK